VTVWSQGLNQSATGTDKGNAVINLHLLTGRIGRLGMGPFSITGQPNAMGGREVGGLANQLAAHVDFGDTARAEIVRAFWQAPALAAEPGPKAVDLFRAVRDGRIKALWIMATNPAASLPDADGVRDAIAACPFVVVSDCVRHTDTTRLADVLLPAAAWGEKDGTVTNSERRISRQRAFLPPPGEARPDWRIVSAVAHRMGFAQAFPYRRPADLFREHCRLAAAVGTDLGLAPLADISDADYDALEPLTWPVGSGQGPIAEGRFFHPDGRARFVPIVPHGVAAEADTVRPLLLNTGRYRDHWHTLTRSGRSATLSRHRETPLLDLHPADAAALGIAAGTLVAVESRHGRVVLEARLSDEVRLGQAFAPIHWTGEEASAARVDSLVAPCTDPISGQPESKAVPVRLGPFAPLWTGAVFSREPLRPVAVAWWVRTRIKGGCMTRLADDTLADDWSAWARRMLGHGGDWLEFRDAGRGIYRGVRLVGGRLSGCLFVGPGAAPDRAAIVEALAAERLAPQEATALLAGAAAGADPGPLVCACFGVGQRTIQAALAEGRATCTGSLGRLLKAGTNCGSCLPELEALLSAGTP
jgi:assimilatory nitrate reductase catalytic subunit